MSDFKEYKPVEPEYNVQAAVENMKKAYWSNEPGKFAKIFSDAEAIIISAICHHGYTLCKETTEGDCISREALKKDLISYVRDKFEFVCLSYVLDKIDNAPAVEYTFEKAFQKTVCEQRLYCPARPKGEWRDNLIEVFRQSAEVGGDMFHLSEIERIINGEPI